MPPPSKRSDTSITRLLATTPSTSMPLQTLNPIPQPESWMELLEKARLRTPEIITRGFRTLQLAIRDGRVVALAAHDDASSSPATMSQSEIILTSRQSQRSMPSVLGPSSS